MILINLTNEASYDYVVGKKEDLYNDVTLRLDRLPIGKYILICSSYSLSDCLLRVYTPSNIAMEKFTGNSMVLL